MDHSAPIVLDILMYLAGGLKCLEYVADHFQHLAELDRYEMCTVCQLAHIPSRSFLNDLAGLKLLMF